MGCAKLADASLVSQQCTYEMEEDQLELGELNYRVITYFPSGENWIVRIGLWKLKWCNTTPLLKLTSKARPSESDVSEVSGILGY